MNIGFLSDKDGYRSPLFPETIEKYENVKLFAEDNIFDNINLNIKKHTNVLKLDEKSLSKIDLLCFVENIELETVKKLKENAGVLGLFNDDVTKTINAVRPDLKLYDFNKLPRISRAQNLDALSSQANLLGYASVLRASLETSNVIPMMTTAAGNISPAKVLILGIGVAGLQAIATAKRLGARVWGYDIRADVKDQVESLGAKFVETNESKQDSVYAQEISKEEQKLLNQALEKQVIESDIVLTFAQIPGKKAPVLINNDTISKMKENSVIIDLAAGTGGNCEATTVNETKIVNGVKVIGDTEILRIVNQAASKLYSENIKNFVDLYFENKSDEIFEEMSR